METNKNEIYVCSVEDTIKYGIICAAIIGRVRMWCEYNETHKVKDRYHNGQWWSGFMSPKEFALQIGISYKTIESNLYKLTKDGILIKDNFNKKPYDKTGWYRVNPPPPERDTLPLSEEHPTSEKGDTLPLSEEHPTSEKGTPFLGEGGPIPVNPVSPINHSVNHSVNPTVNARVEVTEENLKKLLQQSNLDKNLFQTIDGLFKNLEYEHKLPPMEKYDLLTDTQRKQIENKLNSIV